MGGLLQPDRTDGGQVSQAVVAACAATPPQECIQFIKQLSDAIAAAPDSAGFLTAREFCIAFSAEALK